MSPLAPATSAVPQPAAGESVAARVVPWHLLAVAFASTSIIVGGIWDISWHRSIGRDSFWTPAHLAIYLGGIVAGLTCGWLVLRATFAGDVRARAAGVSFWGFRGPLGAWVCIWGSFAMVVSAPFDDWWHNAYGLDVEILSPPHLVLSAGIFAIGVGAMLMALAQQNNAGGRDRLLQRLYVYTGGLLVLMLATLFTEHIMLPNNQHAPAFFFICAAVFPILLVAIARGSSSRWGATGAAGVYMGVSLLMIWILQLFPAQPMLAPIMRQIDHMIPPSFPLLLVLPALVVDFTLNRLPADTGRLRTWLAAVGGGVAAIVVLGVVQWFFAEFMLTEQARNFFFAGDLWDYYIPPGAFQYEFWGRPLAAGDLGWVALVAAASSLAGLWWGNWMDRVRR